MNDFLPSRRVIAFVLVPVITLFLLWGVTAYYNTPEVKKQEASKLALSLDAGNKVFRDRDTDGDGLKDWEEFLYQTDEQDSDTDGDGLSDGAEVKRGYDPLVSGQGEADKVGEEANSGFTFYKDDESLTATDVLARDIFITYTELREADALSLEGIRDSAINQAISENTQVSNQFDYQLEDTIGVASNSASIKAYRQGYVDATNILIPIQFSEIELFSRYVTQSDESALLELSRNKEKFNLFAQELLQIPVPQDLQPIHVELINNILIMTASIDRMLLVDGDPLTALVYAQKFLEDEKLIYKNTEAILLYFKSNGL